MLVPLALGMPGFGEWLLIAAVGLLIFGKRLPEVGRSLGKSIVEFKKGIKGIEDDVEVAATGQNQRQIPQSPAQPTHRFDPYTGKPIEQPGVSQNPPQ